MLEAIAAKTHSSEYLLHKYWARKPHNVLAQLIQWACGDEKCRVLDPFCGSGVFLREASLLGHDAVGFDVNPIAAKIAGVTCNAPDLSAFIKILSPILDRFEHACSELFRTTSGEIVRYYVHECVARCGTCTEIVPRSRAKEVGRSVLCPTCGSRISFSLATLVSTNITRVVTSNETITEACELSYGKELESRAQEDKNSPYDRAFAPNRRILAFSGMTTRSLFTERSFALLCRLADELHRIEDRAVRDAALLLLTGSVAQCSRLIAYRNNLKGGGPAWSVPGFWVPAVHLETNPYFHIRARYKKFLRGLESLNKRGGASVVIRNSDCASISEEVDGKFDLVFLDPPYGDSVPYVEFSAIWNSFLRAEADPSLDISVSDREDVPKKEAWKRYKSALSRSLCAIEPCLNPGATVILTFNNNDYRAWEALIGATQGAKLVCRAVRYQIPAVVSAKAQFSRDGSYISDIYGVFSRDDAFRFSSDLGVVREDLIRAALARGARIPRNTLLRVAYLSLLRNNISSTLFAELEKIISDCFARNENYYDLKANPSFNQESLGEMLGRHARHGMTYIEVIRAIGPEIERLGLPEPYEVANLLPQLELDV